MIPRYARPEMTALWSPETKYRIWFEIEAHAADAMAELGVMPKEAARVIWEKGRNAKFDVDRIDAIEREVKHDVIAFLTHLAEFVGEEARFVHQGMTSSDVLDTCLAVQLSRAADILIADVDALMKALKTPRLRIPAHADDRPQPRHPRRADDVRAQARGLLCRVRARRARVLSRRARRSPPARSRAPSARSQTSDLKSKPMSRRRWGSRWSRSPRR